MSFIIDLAGFTLWDCDAIRPKEVFDKNLTGRKIECS